MVHSSIRIPIPSNKRVESKKILMSLAIRTRVEPGCISCNIYQCVEDKNVLMIDQLWQSKEDLERHLRSDDYFKVLLIVDTALETPEIRFDTIKSSTGFETIEKARSTLQGNLKRLG